MLDESDYCIATVIIDDRLLEMRVDLRSSVAVFLFQVLIDGWRMAAEGK